jgi:uncharacterized heparinase superfamily protein/NAD-dependent dihydropyrimidine dehydrogenase PreA subunit
MAIGSVSGQGRQLRFALSAFRRLSAFRFHSSLLYRWRYAGPVPERLLIAPIDLRTADPTAALDIYAGRFVFAGEGIDADGLSVFDAEPPSDEWARQLHGFGWLRHLRATDMAISRSNARSLVDEWIRSNGRHDPIAWEPDVAARRIISWLAQTPLVLEGCDLAFYRRFMKSITRQIRYLRRTAYDGFPGLPRLRVMIALAASALSMSDQPRFLKQASRWLDLELVRQVLPDGGHISRNPGAILEILMDLLPLRQAFASRGGQPSRILLSAIDRMMPMLRFFRQGDGSFGHFNGCGDTASDQLATVLAYDDVRGAPLSNAPHSGYQRIEAGDAILLVDSGRPPPVDFSTDGMFVAGMAHYPKPMEESVAQALAASARAATLLSKMEVSLDAVKATVDPDYCDGCALCVDVCPYNAITLITEEAKTAGGQSSKLISVNKAQCKGCGLCQGTCPKRGVYVSGFTMKQISSQIQAALAV